MPVMRPGPGETTPGPGASGTQKFGTTQKGKEQKA